MDSSFCISALELAIRRYGAPDIFNSDQGIQFTSEAFTSVLKYNDIKISMDVKAGGWIMFSLSGYGAVLNMKTFICTITF